MQIFMVGTVQEKFRCGYCIECLLRNNKIHNMKKKNTIRNFGIIFFLPTFIFGSLFYSLVLPNKSGYNYILEYFTLHYCYTKAIGIMIFINSTLFILITSVFYIPLSRFYQRAKVIWLSLYFLFILIIGKIISSIIYDIFLLPMVINHKTNPDNMPSPFPINLIILFLLSFIFDLIKNRSAKSDQIIYNTPPNLDHWLR